MAIKRAGLTAFFEPLLIARYEIDTVAPNKFFALFSYKSWFIAIKFKVAPRAEVGFKIAHIFQTIGAPMFKVGDRYCKKMFMKLKSIGTRTGPYLKRFTGCAYVIKRAFFWIP